MVVLGIDPGTANTGYGVVLTPGHAFGAGGEGWFRLSLVADVPVLEEAVARLAAAGVRWS